MGAITSTIAGIAAYAASASVVAAETVGLTGSLVTAAGYAGAGAAYAGMAYGAYSGYDALMDGGSQSYDGLTISEMPEAPEVEAGTSEGDEGIRKGSMLRSVKDKQTALYMTRGTRADDVTLGGYRQTLG